VHKLITNDILAIGCNVQKSAGSTKIFAVCSKLLLQYYMALYLYKVYTSMKANYVAPIKSESFRRKLVQGNIHNVTVIPSGRKSRAKVS